MAKKKKNNKKKRNNTSRNNIINKVEKNNINETETLKKYYLIIAGIIFVIFGLIYGFKVLIPTNTDWTFFHTGDLMQHYVGWESFRAGNWTFPIGLTNATSYPTNISVIYTDSIPILALFFKMISFILPKKFQYLGLYGLLCFILQGILSAQIVKKYTDSKLNIIAVSILFTIIPSMIFRMFYHTALSSQWLLLLSLETLFLYDEFKEGKKIYYMWALIAFLVSTIHIYYLLMCGIVLVGYILLDILNTKKIKKSIILLITYLLTSVLSIWIFGGFVNMTKNDSYGFGMFSYNLNGLINSQGYSVFLKKLPMIAEQYEGFSYLGLGVILLIITSIVLSVIWFIKDKEDIKQHKNLIISLIFISIISILVAASPKVYLGEHLLFELKLPNFIMNMWSIFRSTGRMIWPVIHILMLLSVIIILKRLNWKYALLIISICTVIQVLDIGTLLMQCHEQYALVYTKQEKYDLYKYDYLKKAASNKNIKYLFLVSNDFYDSDKITYSDWALNNGLKTNKMFFARTSFNEILDKNTKKILVDPNKSTVFLFTNEKECTSYNLICHELPSEYYLGYIKEL